MAGGFFYSAVLSSDPEELTLRRCCLHLKQPSRDSWPAGAFVTALRARARWIYGLILGMVAIQRRLKNDTSERGLEKMGRGSRGSARAG